MSAANLPPIVEHFLRRSYAQQFAQRQTVQLCQHGDMRLGPGKPWLPFRAEQQISVTRLQFRWVARVRLAPGLWVKVTDAFEDGRGRLAVALWGLIPIAKAQGPDLDRSEAQRYLAELAWCPMALQRNTALQMQSLSADSFRIWAGDEAASVTLQVNEEGDIVRAYSPSRYRQGLGNQPWEGKFQNYTERSGLRVPQQASVAWLGPDGPFEYWRGHLTEFAL